jgi:hypothetical protein
MNENFQTLPRKRPSRIGSLFFNLLTFVILLAIIVVGASAAAIFFNPYINVGFFYNPFPPPTVPALLGSPTPTHTPAVPLPDAWTATPYAYSGANRYSHTNPLGNTHAATVRGSARKSGPDSQHRQ